MRFIFPRYLRNCISLITEIRGNKTTIRALNRSVKSARYYTSVSMSTDLDIARCCDFAKKLALEAGKILNCNVDSEKNIRAKGIEEWDFVTDFDHKIEKLLVDGITQEFPDHKIIAEEMVAAAGAMPELTDAPTWLLDPIDGTHNFIHTFPQSCISIGLAVCKEPVMGVIYNPVSSELYSAIKDEGAFLNGMPICTSKITEIKKALLVMEPSLIKFNTKNRDIQIGRMIALIDSTQCIRSIGSAAIAMAYIARGAVDSLYIENINVWDIAAGTVIVREAGGTVLDTRGGAYDIMKPNTLATSSEILARDISKLIVDTDLKTQRKRLRRT